MASVCGKARGLNGIAWRGASAGAGLDPRGHLDNNPRVPVRRRLAAALLLLTVAALPGLWLGAQALGHGHAEDAAEALVHGHEHADGTPEHDHPCLPSLSLRPEPPPPDLQAPALAALQAPVPDGFPLSGARRWRDWLQPPSSSPPRLHLLCTLLI